MAVPKKKRYKQIVRFRRSLQRTNNLSKNNIKKALYRNFVWLKDNNDYIYFDKNYAYSEINISKNICLNCYNNDFLGAYTKYKKN